MPDIQHKVTVSSHPPSSRDRASEASSVDDVQEMHVPNVSPTTQIQRMKGNIDNSDIILTTIVDPGEIPVTSVPESDVLNRNEEVLFEEGRHEEWLIPGLLIYKGSDNKHASEDHGRMNSDTLSNSQHVTLSDVTVTEASVAFFGDTTERNGSVELVTNSTSSPFLEKLGIIEQLKQEWTPFKDATISYAEEIDYKDTTLNPVPITADYKSSNNQLRHINNNIGFKNPGQLEEIPGTATPTDMPSTTEFAGASTTFLNERAMATEEPLGDAPETLVTVTSKISEPVETGIKEKHDTTWLVTEEYLYTTIPVSEETTYLTLPVTDNNSDSKFIVNEMHNTVASDTIKTVSDDFFNREETNESMMSGTVNSNIVETATAGIDENFTEVTETLFPFTEKILGVSEDRIKNDHVEEHGLKESTLEMNEIETTEMVILEASMGTNHVTTEGPLEPTSFDVKIKTIKDLQVDAIFDPSQVAKATSYEESSYSTATRSATVTTWVDPNTKNFVSQGSANLTDLKEVVNSSQNLNGDLENIKLLTDYLSGSHNHGMGSVDKGFPTTQVSSVDDKSSYSTTYYEATASNKDAGSKEEKVSVTEFSRSEGNDKLSTSQVNPDPYESDTPRIPVLKFNIGEFETVNGTRVYLTDSGKTETQFIYEMPNMNRSSGPHLTPSVVIALSICCSLIVLISILTVSLWFCRRHKNRSKIYLSRDAARPRAFFTKPMIPALLPDEAPDLSDPMYVMEFQKPRPPIVLSDDPDCIIIDGQTVLKSETEAYDGGIENKGFVDIPLEEIKSANYSIDCSSNKTCGRMPPKAGLKSDHECDSDSGIRVWSSTGSLYTVSRDMSHCSLPPPPYSSSIGEESVNLSADTFPSFGSKPGLLYA
ncbi:uncharacterized protein LOC135223970 [Macrobrachium nipponense]|uniref:uncharacterized protein LOC135223970 n=1 Tax=Macrobrachium nipponense TaxID=159736 RepID=UPI0030C80CE0